MRVVHVITGLEAGGAEQQLAMLLQHTRHDAEVVSLEGIGSVGRRLTDRGVHVHALGMRGNRDVASLRRLVRVLARSDPDVVHVHLYRACIYGRIAARLAGVPTVVTTEHSLGDTHIEGRRRTAGIRALYLATARLSRTTIAVSEAVRERLLDWGLPGSRVEVIPNGLDGAAMRFDADARAQIRKEFALGPDQLVIGSVGRLHPVKRFDELVRAAGPLLRSGAHLLLVGDGPERGRLEDLAGATGVAEQVSMPGERADVARLLAAMDVYAAPSAEETFGLAVLEALASGLPAVVGQCPALDGFDLPQVQHLAAPDELPAALEAAAAWSEDHRGRPRTPARALTQRYDIRVVSRTVDDLYDRLERERRSVPRWRLRRPGARNGGIIGRLLPTRRPRHGPPTRAGGRPAS